MAGDGVVAQQHCADLLPGIEAASRVRNAGDGDPVDRDHGDQSAADVHKGAKALQPGHGGVQNGAAGERAQMVQCAALCGAAGQQRREPAVVCLQSDDLKADRLAHPGQHRDLPQRALPQAKCGFVPRDHALPAAQPDVQIFFAVASLGQCLDDGFLMHGFRQ